MNILNLILNTDSYKFSHKDQYPKDTINLFSYTEARWSKMHNVNKTLFVGLQGFVKEYLLTPITKEDIDEAQAIITAHGFDFNRKDWEIVLNDYNGLLPVRIRAVKEGSLVPISNALCTIEVTDPKLFWLVSHIETALVRGLWYPTTVATVSFTIRQIINEYLKETCDNPKEELAFKLHDFGARGVSSFESACVGGFAHIATGFMGTDTVSSLLYARKYYNEKGVPAFSINASEHSTMTSHGRENELRAYRQMVKNYAKPGALFACVIDSYDTFNAVNMWCADGGLLPRVEEQGARVVLRPDSGDPIETPVKVIELLMHNLGFTVNGKGFKVLPSYVRVIQGDGVNPDSIRQILEILRAKGISTENIGFGMGAALLQKVDRDTFGFAQKACARQNRDGEWIDVFKTSPGKSSKRGRLMYVASKNDGSTMTIKEDNFDPESHQDLMTTVYENGEILREVSLEEIRQRANLYL